MTCIFVVCSNDGLPQYNQALTFERPKVDMPPATNMATLVQLADAESAEALQHWTLATLCRCLSLNNILSLLTSALLERQIALFCPNIGLLSASVLAVVPLLRPFSWQSLMLPVLPLNMLEIVEVRSDGHPCCDRRWSDLCSSDRN